MKLIDAEPIIKFITDGLNDTENPMGHDAIKILTEIQYAPKADAEPVRHAHWIDRTRDHRNDYYDVMEYPYRCSACRVKSKELTKRCPDCGAKMDEKEKKNDSF